MGCATSADNAERGGGKGGKGSRKSRKSTRVAVGQQDSASDIKSTERGSQRRGTTKKRSTLNARGRETQSLTSRTSRATPQPGSPTSHNADNNPNPLAFPSSAGSNSQELSGSSGTRTSGHGPSVIMPDTVAAGEHKSPVHSPQEHHHAPVEPVAPMGGLDNDIHSTSNSYGGAGGLPPAASALAAVSGSSKHSANGGSRHDGSRSSSCHSSAAESQGSRGRDGKASRKKAGSRKSSRSSSRKSSKSSNKAKTKDGGHSSPTVQASARLPQKEPSIPSQSSEAAAAIASDPAAGIDPSDFDALLAARPAPSVAALVAAPTSAQLSTWLTCEVPSSYVAGLKHHRLRTVKEWVDEVGTTPTAVAALQSYNEQTAQRITPRLLQSNQKLIRQIDESRNRIANANRKQQRVMTTVAGGPRLNSAFTVQQTTSPAPAGASSSVSAAAATAAGYHPNTGPAFSLPANATNAQIAAAAAAASGAPMPGGEASRGGSLGFVMDGARTLSLCHDGGAGGDDEDSRRGSNWSFATSVMTAATSLALAAADSSNMSDIMELVGEEEYFDELKRRDTELDQMLDRETMQSPAAPYLPPEARAGQPQRAAA